MTSEPEACEDCECSWVLPLDGSDPGAYPGPDPDCDCGCHYPEVAW